MTVIGVVHFAFCLNINSWKLIDHGNIDHDKLLLFYNDTLRELLQHVLK